MIAEGPTLLSLTACAVYAVVFALCFRAAQMARSNGLSADQRSWMMIACLFGFLIVMRVFVLDDLIREALREYLGNRDAYADRRSLQFPLAIMALLAGLGVLGVSAHRLWLASSTRRRMVWIGRIAAMAMVTLVVLRLISLGPIDYVLDGPLRVNWWLDLGSSFVSGTAAWRYLNFRR